MAKLSARRQGLRNKRERQQFEPFVCHRYEMIDKILTKTETRVIERAKSL